MQKEVLDKSNYKLDLENFLDEIDRGYRLGSRVSFEEFNDVFICGMGGSAIAGDLLNEIVDFPIRVIRSYNLPAYVDSSSLVFIVSYSGNTEETISCFKEAVFRKCKIVVLSSGGKLKKLALDKNIEHILLPTGHQPRAMLPFMFFSILRTLENCFSDLNFDKEVKKLTRSSVNILELKKISNQLYNKIPLIYSSSQYSSVAKRFKCQFNENAKTLAFFNEFSEMNHNEIMGFERINGNYAVIFLRTSDEHPQIKKRFSIVKKLISGLGVSVVEIKAFGGSKLERMFNLILRTDWISYFLALEYGLDPSEINLIENLKKKI